MSLLQLIAKSVLPLKRKLTDDRIENLDNLDTKISDLLSSDDDRLNHLDADVSSRLSETTFNDDERLDRIDTTVSSRLPTSTFNNDTRLNRLDAAISSRVSTAYFDALVDTTVSSRLAAADYVSSPIKSIQRGGFSFNASSSGTITISSVNTAKSVVITRVRSGIQYNTSTGYAANIDCGVRLASSTSLSYVATSNFGSTTHITGTVYWTVIEFN